MMLLGAFEGYLAGLIGMDAASIAILARLLSTNNPKKVSASTSATALLVSATALLLYIIGAEHNIAATVILVAGLSGFLGGIAGTLLMHRMPEKRVKQAIAVLLALAAVEILVKMMALL